MSAKTKEIIFPTLIFFVSIIGFIYIKFIEPNDSVEKKITLKSSHDPKVYLDENLKVPTVKLNLVEDKKGGVNIKVDFENFVLSPKSVNTEDRPNEGHMHLYVNGYKIARVYSDWFHIDESYLEVGENDITVTLNTNMHNVWTYASGTPVTDTIKYFKKIN